MMPDRRPVRAATAPPARAPAVGTMWPDQGDEDMGALTARLELSAPARVLLATLLVAAGAIHLAMVPSHASSSRVEGLTFAIAGSVQLLLGVVVAQRPSWLVLGSSVVVSVAAIAAWALSRTRGLPYGAHEGVAEAATQVDVTTVVLEFATLIVVVVIALSPGVGASWPRAAVALASVLPVIVLVVTADALSSPGALDHGHADGEAAAGEPGHLHAAGASAPAVTPVAAAEEGALDDAGRARRDAQLARARAAMERYPTVADARGAGMYDATSGGGVLRSFVNPANLPHASDPGFDLEHPLVYLYAGSSDRSPVVGVAYYEFSEQGPRGFAGPDDRWRLITGLCSLPKPGGGSEIVSIDTDVSAAACTALDGSYANSVQWSLHAWLAPGWENPEGTFRETNPRVPCVVDAYVRWLDTARGTSARPGPEADAALVADLEACSRAPAGADPAG